MTGSAHFRVCGPALELDAGSVPELAVGVHRVFFETALGMILRRGVSVYVTPTGANLAEALTEALDYLRDLGVDRVLDAGSEELLKRVQETRAVFDAARRTVESCAHVHANSRLRLSLPGFKRKLKPHQIASARHLIDVRFGANFSVPGSGKTTVVYSAFAYLTARNIVDRLVVMGPRSSFMPWEEEFAACFGRKPRVIRLSGSRERRRRLYLAVQRAELVLVTYQTAAQDVDDLMRMLQGGKVFLVVDEAHNIKSFSGGLWASTALALAPYAVRRAVLTGTPMPQGLADLWSQFTFLWPGSDVLGNKEQYKYACAQPGAAKSIAARIRPFFVRVRKEDLHLPPRNFARPQCSLGPIQARIYGALAARILSDLASAPAELRQLREWRKARMVRLLQAASNPTLLAQYSDEFNVPPLDGTGASLLQLIERYPEYETPAKMLEAVRLATSLVDAGEKVIIWSVFIHNIQMLARILHEHAPLMLYGAVPRDDNEDEEWNRERVVREFRGSKGPRILLANPAACAESISLHKVCRHAIYLDRTFNCGQYLQSLDRIHRVGLEPEETVSYHVLLARDTIDEVIDERLTAKEARMEELLRQDLPVIDLDLGSADVSDVGEEADFSATAAQLRRRSKRGD